MQLISDYMRDERSLRMLNELTRKTFGFDFDGWVKGGYFEGDYIPYSLVEDGKMILLGKFSGSILKTGSHRVILKEIISLIPLLTMGKRYPMFRQTA